ncbi:MAG: carboxypeptidase regulatory-like domain-containing protein [Candidatus Cloacimonetes bacterium]|nr:carboxypeptidase regulatory-like domain-containing protein [Candidatus Cloacimonadota bacterium]
MLKKIGIVVSLLLLLIPLLAKSNEIYFKFQINSKEEVNKISRIISIDNVIGNTVYAYANQRELSNFNQLGYSYSLIKPFQKSWDSVMATSKEEMRNWDSYPTYETYVDIMNQFAIDYPDICTVTNIGQSVEGRDILVAKISDNPNVEENEPEFFYTGQMHGNELVTFILLLHLIDYLTENYGTNDRITNIVDNIEIHINPLSNPDGTYAGGNHTVWDATRNNANSIDLNRNFPDPEDGSHPDGNEWQPESIIMMDFAEEQTFVLSSNLHSGIELVNYPWDTWAQLSADDEWWQEVCHTYADTVHLYAPLGYMDEFDNGITNGYAWFTMNGGRQDYMNCFQRCREMTLELADEKYLPESQLEAHWEYNRQSFLLYMEECLYGIRGVVTNTSAEPLLAEITILNHDIDNSEVFTDPDIGDYHRMLFPGTYDVKFNAFGYFPQTVQNVQIFDNNVVIQNIQLEESPQFTISGVVLNAFNSDPIENAEVELLNTPLDPVITNENGEYEILCVHEDSYEIQISAEGFATALEEIAVNEQSTVFDFELYESETEDFETGDFSSFSWEFAGDTDWIIDNANPYEGIYSAKSGDINDNQESGLLINLETTFDGNISFYRKTSSEAGYDYLKFYIDGMFVERWSGNSDWGYSSYFVEAGNHVFKWEYDKDGDVSSGSDCAWLDYISFPPTGIAHASNENVLLKVKLISNYPNPFNPSTTIAFETNTQNIENTEIIIYNLKGQKVKVFNSFSNIGLGTSEVVWDGTDENNKQVSSGVYFYKLKSGNYMNTKKMLLLK